MSFLGSQEGQGNFENEIGEGYVLLAELDEMHRKIYKNGGEGYEYLRNLGWNGKDRPEIEDDVDFNEQEIKAGMEDWVKEVSPELKKWLKFMHSVQVVVRSSSKARYLEHDTNTIAATPQIYLQQIISDFSSSKGHYKDVDKAKKVVSHLSYLLIFWERYYVAVQDILLRMVSENSVPEKYRNGLDLGMVKNVIGYFQGKELKKIQSDDKLIADFRKKVLADEILLEMKKRDFYRKPSVVKQDKIKERRGRPKRSYY